jgi:Domain of unknown function (DUF6285)
MQERPEARAVLEALARFLLEELQPAVADKRLAFRVLIAAHLASTVAAELDGRPGHAQAELLRLSALLPDVPISSDVRVALRDLNAALVDRVMQQRLSSDDAAVRAHLKATLAEALGVFSPRFDTSSEIEG